MGERQSDRRTKIFRNNLRRCRFVFHNKKCVEIETHDTSQAFRLMILLTHLTGFIRGGFAI